MPIPIYPASAAIDTWNIRKAVALALENIAGIEDPMPLEICRTAKLWATSRRCAASTSRSTTATGCRRSAPLRFHEAFLLQTALLQRRRDPGDVRRDAARAAPGGLLARFDAALPFELTDDQKLVGAEIAADLAGEVPMHRLLQGEVGSGKTLVALRAMLAVAERGGQSALLAPTEVLAAQHLRSIAAMLGPDLAAGCSPTLVDRAAAHRLAAAPRSAALLACVTGQARIVVGTHALLPRTTAQFYDLGLVVVDEQHRFGVEQREALRRKGEPPPHVLVMTATPIPRTVAMTVFGDLDVSTHRATCRRARADRDVRRAARREAALVASGLGARRARRSPQGRQGFVVCPRDRRRRERRGRRRPRRRRRPARARRRRGRWPTVAADARRAARDPALAGLADRGAARPDAGRGEGRASCGRSPPASIDVLVATTVIEVGVDVPNASIMVVLDADRFGVSQLHQLRGRVGRGGLPGLCLLVTGAPEGTLGARAGRRGRRHARTASRSPRLDLELRREGDVLGAAQSGARSQLKLLRVTRDGDIIEAARDAAAERCSRRIRRLEAYPALRPRSSAAATRTRRAFLDKS